MRKLIQDLYTAVIELILDSMILRVVYYAFMKFDY